jgi:NADH-quinone oxidoreductase subunit K
VNACVPILPALYLAAGLFVIGLAGVLLRRNLLFILMSLELMLNGAALAFVAGAARWQQADGQVMFIFVLTMAAAEAAVGLALVFQVAHRFGGIDADAVSRMRG